MEVQQGRLSRRGRKRYVKVVKDLGRFFKAYDLTDPNPQDKIENKHSGDDEASTKRQRRDDEEASERSTKRQRRDDDRSTKRQHPDDEEASERSTKWPCLLMGLHGDTDGEACRSPEICSLKGDIQQLLDFQYSDLMALVGDQEETEWFEDFVNLLDAGLQDILSPNCGCKPCDQSCYEVLKMLRAGECFSDASKMWTEMLTKGGKAGAKVGLQTEKNDPYSKSFITGDVLTLTLVKALQIITGAVTKVPTKDTVQREQYNRRNVHIPVKFYVGRDWNAERMIFPTGYEAHNPNPASSSSASSSTEFGTDGFLEETTPNTKKTKNADEDTSFWATVDLCNPGPWEDMIALLYSSKRGKPELQQVFFLLKDTSGMYCTYPLGTTWAMEWKAKKKQALPGTVTPALSLTALSAHQLMKDISDGVSDGVRKSKAALSTFEPKLGDGATRRRLGLEILPAKKPTSTAVITTTQAEFTHSTIRKTGIGKIVRDGFKGFGNLVRAAELAYLQRKRATYEDRERKMQEKIENLEAQLEELKGSIEPRLFDDDEAEADDALDRDVQLAGDLKRQLRKQKKELTAVSEKKQRLQKKYISEHRDTRLKSQRTRSEKSTTSYFQKTLREA